MIVIADSGSTKTEWCFFTQDGVDKTVISKGLNPYFLTAQEIVFCLEEDVQPFVNQEVVKEVYFYGSGCASKDKQSIVHTALKDFFLNADIMVESDLLGSAKALSTGERSQVAILGTGSSICIFDGENIEMTVPSLGYILGDNGSGAKIGMKLLKDYLQADMPDDVAISFKEFAIKALYGDSVGKEDILESDLLSRILDSVYCQNFPNRFLAQFALFIEDRVDNEYIYNLINSEFRNFFEKQVLPYNEGLKLRISGSLAFFAAEILVAMAKEYNIDLDNIKQSPMQGLLQLYSKEIIKNKA